MHLIPLKIVVPVSYGLFAIGWWIHWLKTGHTFKEAVNHARDDIKMVFRKNGRGGK